MITKEPCTRQLHRNRDRTEREAMDAFGEFVSAIDSRSDVIISRGMSDKLDDGDALLDGLEKAQRRNMKQGMENQELNLEEIGKRIY